MGAVWAHVRVGAQINTETHRPKEPERNTETETETETETGRGRERGGEEGRRGGGDGARELEHHLEDLVVVASGICLVAEKVYLFVA